MKYFKDLNNAENITFMDFDTSFTSQDICQRTALDYDSIIKKVMDIKNGVITKKDEYIKELTFKYDGVKLETFEVEKKDILQAVLWVTPEFKVAIQKAYNNISTFHKRQLRKNLQPKQTSKWIYCWQEFRAIQRVGLYIPGGTAPLFSTLLMLWIPAKLAWCKDIILCTPPNKQAKVSQEILYVANMLWLEKIYMIGWAQAIFAMGYGCNEFAPVDKIFWPWNSFVTAAKMLLSRSIAIDMPAWPSEVLVIANEDSNPIFVASDLLSQAEHGADSQVVLVCNSKEMIAKILQEISKQKQILSRQDIITQSLKNSFVIVTDSQEESIAFSNQYAPEHLILQIRDWRKYIPQIENAGSVFCGKYTPESAGDYISWTNHTLPTSSFAKSYSGVGVESFWKRVTFQNITKTGIQDIGKDIEILADLEWLTAHKNAVSVRL